MQYIRIQLWVSAEPISSEQNGSAAAELALPSRWLCVPRPAAADLLSQRPWNPAPCPADRLSPELQFCTVLLCQQIEFGNVLL